MSPPHPMVVPPLTDSRRLPYWTHTFNPALNNEFECVTIYLIQARYVETWTYMYYRRECSI